MLASVLELRWNPQVSYVDFYGDRVVHAWIEDNKGNGTAICIDCRIGSPTRFRLFQGGKYPNKGGAALVELGSAEEGLIIPLLSRWFDSDGPRKMGVLSFSERGYEVFQEALNRYGEPQTSPAACNPATEGEERHG